MATCAACGRWAGRADEPCPHCGASPRKKTGTASSRSDPLTFVDELLADESETGSRGARARPPMDMSQRTPTPAEFERWYPALDESPVFAGTSAPPRTPRVPPAPPALPGDSVTGAFLDDEEDPSAPAPHPVLEPVIDAVLEPLSGPVVMPVPVMEPISAPVVAPILEPLGAAPVLTPLGAAARDDDRSVKIDVRTEFVSYDASDEPLANVLVTVTPDGASLLDPSREPVAHVILALDVSASMNRTDKYPLLTEALAGMLYDLRRPGCPDVLLSVVLYAYGAETVFRDQPASKLEPRDVLRAIDKSSLRFGRYTDMVGAMQRAGRIAYDQVKANKAMPVRICLLTDGRPQDVEGTRRAIAQVRRLPVDVDALAFGKDADVAVLQDLVSGGRGGTVKQIRSDTIGEAFGRIAETAANVVTNRAMFDFELAPGVVGGAAYRYRPARHRFGDSAFDGGRTFRTDLGTMEAGRGYSLLFQVRLPETTSWETHVGTISVRLPGHGGARSFEADVAVPRHKGHEALEPDREVQAANDVLSALGASDPKEQLRALRVRREIYVSERRDDRLIAAVDRAIRELEQGGTLDRLSPEEQAALLSHTRTVVGAK